MNTNAQILAAILNRVGQPVIQHYIGMKIQNSQMAGAVENWVRNLGITGPNWNLASELMPFVQPMSGMVVEPMLAQYISNIPDEMIPGMAHSVVDKALQMGNVSVLGGMITIDEKDLREIKRLLNANMPYIPMQPVTLKEGTEAPEETQKTEVKDDGSNDAGAGTKQAKHA